MVGVEPTRDVEGGTDTLSVDNPTTTSTSNQETEAIGVTKGNDSVKLSDASTPKKSEVAVSSPDTPDTQVSDQASSIGSSSRASSSSTSVAGSKVSLKNMGKSFMDKLQQAGRSMSGGDKPQDNKTGVDSVVDDILQESDEDLHIDINSILEKASVEEYDNYYDNYSLENDIPIHSAVLFDEEQEVSTLADDTIAGSITPRFSVFPNRGNNDNTRTPEETNSPKSPFKPRLSMPIFRTNWLGRDQHDASGPQLVPRFSVFPSRGNNDTTTPEEVDNPKSPFKPRISMPIFRTPWQGRDQHDAPIPQLVRSKSTASKSHSSGDISEPTLHNEAEHKRSVAKRRFIKVAVFLAIMLFLFILLLSIGYRKLRIYNNESSEPEGDDSDPIFEPWMPTSSPTTAPTSAPTTAPAPTMTPTSSTPIPTSAPLPTAAPEEISTVDLDQVAEVLTSYGVDVESFLSDEDSPRYRSLAWLAGDPNVESYPEHRLLQRWVLGTCALSWATDESGVNFASVGLPGWMDTSLNECSWFSTTGDDVCDDEGYYQSLDLEDPTQPLYGTIPTEIALLTRLRHIYFRDNSFSGTIPSELSRLDDLERLQLTSNTFTGQIPSELGLFTELAVLGMGSNRLNGTLPKELGDLEELKELVLDKNKLTGDIPRELQDLEELEVLVVGNNLLEGDMPKRICDMDLETLSADCHLVECDCCTECVATLSPTPRPTAAPPTSIFPICSPDTDEWISWTATYCLDSSTLEWWIAFSHCQVPNSGDWIGIFRADTDVLTKDAATMWLWPCGTSCGDSLVSQNSIGGTTSSFLLETDETYVAHFIRTSADTTDGYEVLLTSDTMRVDSSRC
eukprot:Nitzschia sp. Nitz4//scaffold101_size76361//28750//31650//NITZ4_005600-RA/size76361-augustus-gene-0.10-mRNA-1//-1//CDS//3329532152//8261//frame0